MHLCRPRASTGNTRPLPSPGLGGRTMYWPRGRVVGGSSSINALVYCRGMPADFDDWRALGNRGWGWDDVRPYFERSERRVAADGRVAHRGAARRQGRHALSAPHAHAVAGGRGRTRTAGHRRLQRRRTPKVSAAIRYRFATAGAGRRPMRSCGPRCSAATSSSRPTRGRRKLRLRGSPRHRRGIPSRRPAALLRGRRPRSDSMRRAR